MAILKLRPMRVFTKRLPISRLLSLCACGGFLLAAGCFRDLSLPPPPPPVSCKVRVTVTVIRDGPVTVSVSGTRTADADGHSPVSGSIPPDQKSLQPGLSGVARSIEFDLPEDATFVEEGSWDFTIT